LLVKNELRSVNARDRLLAEMVSHLKI